MYLPGGPALKEGILYAPLITTVTKPLQDRMSLKPPLLLLVMIFSLLSNSGCYGHLKHKSVSLHQTSSTLALSKIICQAGNDVVRPLLI